MQADPSPSHARLLGWLELMSGPKSKGEEARERALEEMREVGLERIIPMLASLLAKQDLEIRGNASEAMFWLDANATIPIVLPYLDDADSVMRQLLCGLLHDFGDRRAVEPLIKRMRHDPDPQVRGTAAYALGGIGSPEAIPDLIATMESDFEEDCLGYSPSFCATGALDDILQLDETCIRLPGGFKRLNIESPDIAFLKRQALALYAKWKTK